MPEPWGARGATGPPPQYLADQLTLFEPGRADYPHLLLLPPLNVFHLPASLSSHSKVHWENAKKRVGRHASFPPRRSVKTKSCQL